MGHVSWKGKVTCPPSVGDNFTDDTFTAWLQWDQSTVMNLWDGMDYGYWTFHTITLVKYQIMHFLIWMN